MSIEKYDPIRLLGEGSFGKVYLMRDKIKRNFVCVKVIKIKNIPKKERESTRIEVDLLRRLNHPNIVRYFESFLSRNNDILCICMEYCDGGDLATQIKAAKKELFSENKILHWFVQIALGLHYMHSMKVLHRDLKTQNIFLLGNGRLVLGDFGISKVLDGTMDFAQTCIGTPYYMSPEIFQNKPYSYKSDVWALGCVLYEITTLNHAFDSNSLNSLAGKIVKGRYPPISPKYSRSLRELIAQMLLINPQQRPDVDIILRKSFIKKHIINFLADVVSRPETTIGEGTMIVRAAADGFVNGSLSSDSNTMSLHQQLQELDLGDLITEALAPQTKPADIEGAKRMAKDQLSALRREEEHKRMVEAALEKLRADRESRMRQRKSTETPPSSAGLTPQGLPSVSRLRGGVPSNSNIQQSSSKASLLPKQSSGSRLDKLDSGNKDSLNIQGGQVRKLVEQDSVSARRYSREEERGIRPQSSRLTPAEERRRIELREESRIREQNKIREEIRLREELETKQRAELQNARQLQQIGNDGRDSVRRDNPIDKERQRKREEIEQLKRDKIELDRLEKIRLHRLQEERHKSLESKPLPKEYIDYSFVQEKASYQAPARQVIVSASKGALSARAEEKAIASDILLRKQENKLRDDERLALARQVPAPSVIPSSSIIQNSTSSNTSVNIKSPGTVSAIREMKEGLEVNDHPSRRFQAYNDGALLKFESTPAMTTSQLNSSSSKSRSASSKQPLTVPIDDEVEEDYSSDDSIDEKDIFERKVMQTPSGKRLQIDANVEEEDEDLFRKEEELRAEWSFSSQRCKELHRTLKETKSLLKTPKGKDIPSDSPFRHTRVNSGSGGTTFPPTSDSEESYDDKNSFSDVEDDTEEVSSTCSPDISTGNPTQVPSPAMYVTPVRNKSSLKIDTNGNESPSPPTYYNLVDPPTPSGRLIDRIVRLRKKCMDGLGKEVFRQAYRTLQDYEEKISAADGRVIYDDTFEEEKNAKLKSIVGENKANYINLIEQLLFMEETHK